MSDEPKEYRAIHIVERLRLTPREKLAALSPERQAKINARTEEIISLHSTRAALEERT